MLDFTFFMIFKAVSTPIYPSNRHNVKTGCVPTGKTGKTGKKPGIEKVAGKTGKTGNLIRDVGSNDTETFHTMEILQ